MSLKKKKHLTDNKDGIKPSGKGSTVTTVDFWDQDNKTLQ